MKYFLTLALLAITPFCFSQGLNAEVTFNNTIDQGTKAMITIDEFTYVINTEYEEIGPKYTINKIDTNGTILWRQAFQPVAAHYPILHLTEGDNKSILISGVGQKTCDVSNLNFGFVEKMNPDGSTSWNFMREQAYNYNGKISTSNVAIASSNTYKFHYNDDKVSKIYTVNNNGVLIDSVSISKKSFTHIASTSINPTIVAKGDSLFAINNNGQIILSKKYSSTISDVTVFNDTIYVLSSDSLFMYDADLLLIQKNGIAGKSGFSHLYITKNRILFASKSSNVTIHTLDRDLNVIEDKIVAITESDNYDFSLSHVSIASEYSLTNLKAIRYFDFSLQDPSNVSIKRPDVGIINFEKTKVEVVKHPFADNLYDATIYGNVQVKNYGTDTIRSVRINQFNMVYICGPVCYFNQFDGLAIPPGGTQFLTLGMVYSNYISTPNQTVNLDLCLYTSNPNSLTDINVPNDQYCANINYPFAGLSEKNSQEMSVFPNPVNEKLHISIHSDEQHDFRIYNLQGKELLSGKVVSNTIDTQSLIDGYYSIQLSSENGSKHYNHRFVKVND